MGQCGNNCRFRDNPVISSADGFLVVYLCGSADCSWCMVYALLLKGH